MSDALAHRINIVETPDWYDFVRDISMRIAQVQTCSIPISAIALREDCWPLVAEWGGYPVARLPLTSFVRWGVIT